MTWVLCAVGCGFHHRDDDPAPPHDPRWLEPERQRLTVLLHAVETNADPAGMALENVGLRDRVRELEAFVEANLAAPLAVDEVAEARAAREVPRLVDGPGATVGVVLEPPPRRPRGRG